MGWRRIGHERRAGTAAGEGGEKSVTVRGSERRADASAQRCSSRGCPRLIGQRPAVSALGGRRAFSCLPAFCPPFCLGRGRGAEPALPNPAGQGVGARRRTAAGRRAGQGVRDCGRRSGCDRSLLPPCQAMSEARARCIVSRCRFWTSARHCGQQKRGFRAGPAADKSADAGIDR